MWNIRKAATVSISIIVLSLFIFAMFFAHDKQQTGNQNPAVAQFAAPTNATTSVQVAYAQANQSVQPANELTPVSLAPADPSCGAAPSGILYCIPLVIDPTDGGKYSVGAYAANTQIPVIFYPDSTPVQGQDLTPYLAAQLQNVEFYNMTSGKPVYSWFVGDEEFPSYYGVAPLNSLSEPIMFWIDVPAIPSGGNDSNIAMGIGGISNVLVSSTGYAGLAPQITCPNPANTFACPNYGEYDNGQLVFPFYDNFADSYSESGSSGFTEGSFTGGGEQDVYMYINGQASLVSHQGLYVNYANQNDGAFIVSSTGTTPSGYGTGYDILESNMVNNARMGMEISTCNPNANDCSDEGWLFNGMGLSWEPATNNCNGGGCTEFFVIGGTSCSVTTACATSAREPTAGVSTTLDWLDSGIENGYWEYFEDPSIWFSNEQYSSPVLGNPVYFGVGALGSGATVNKGGLAIQWILARNLPPDDVYPAVDWSTITNVQRESPTLSTCIGATCTSPPTSADATYGQTANAMATCYSGSSGTCEVSVSGSVKVAQGPWTGGGAVDAPINTIDTGPGTFTITATDEVSGLTVTQTLYVDPPAPSITILPNPATISNTITVNAICLTGDTCTIGGPSQVVPGAACAFGNCDSATTQVSLPAFPATDLGVGNTVFTYYDNTWPWGSPYFTDTLTILPGLSFSQNPARYYSMVTATVTCTPGDQCSILAPAGVTVSPYTTTGTYQLTFNTSDLGSPGVYTFTASDYNSITRQTYYNSGQLIVLNALTCTIYSENQGNCLVTNSIPISTSYPFSQYGGDGGFVQQTQTPPQTTPVTYNVLQYNIDNPQWFTTCPNQPNPSNTVEYVNPGSSRFVAGDECLVSTSPLESIINLNVRVMWNSNTYAYSNAFVNVTDIAALSAPNLAYSGEAYNNSRGPGSANVSNGYDSYSDIFQGVTSLIQKGLWEWDAKIANVSRITPTNNLQVNQGFPYTSQFSSLQYTNSINGCSYTYTYNVMAVATQMNNTNAVIPIVPQLPSSYLAFNNETYNGVYTASAQMISEYSPNALAMSQGYLPNFWSAWHLIASGATVSIDSVPQYNVHVYQYGSQPVYWTAYGTGVTAFPVYALANSLQYAIVSELPNFYYNVTVPSAYSTINNDFAYYNSSYDVYSLHNLQSPGNFIDPIQIDSAPSIYMNDNGILARLSSASFFGGSNYQGITQPPGLNVQNTGFIMAGNAITANDVYGLLYGQQVGNYIIANITNPMYLAESNNNNLFALTQNTFVTSFSCYLFYSCSSQLTSYYLYDIQYVEPGNFNPLNGTLSQALNYTTTSPSSSTYQQYISKVGSYWVNTTVVQSGSTYVTRAYNLTAIGNVLAGPNNYNWFASYTTVKPEVYSPPLGLASDAAGDVYVISANEVGYTNGLGQDCVGSGNGFHMLYISSGGQILGANVVGGPSNFGSAIASTGCANAYLSTSGTFTEGVTPSMAVSPSGQYVYVSEPNYPYVLIYEMGISNSVLSASYVSAINLSYSTNQYNLSILEYEENGGPYNSNVLKINAQGTDYVSEYYCSYLQQPYTNDSQNNHEPIGLAISRGELYVLDDWNFGLPWWNGHCGTGIQGTSMLMLRVFNLNGTEIPIHASNSSDIITKGGITLTTGYAANKLYPPYGWPLSANFTLDYAQSTWPPSQTPDSPCSGGTCFVSYCAYLCNNTPVYNTAADAAGFSVANALQEYGGYPPIGPTVPASPKSLTADYNAPTPTSITADFNNTVYINTMALWLTGASECDVSPCKAYDEMLAIHMTTENYTRLSNGSTAQPTDFSAYGGQTGYLNNNYLQARGVSIVFPSSYICYIFNETGWHATTTAPTHTCNLEPTNTFDLAPPPFIGMPDPFQYVESAGSADNYLSETLLGSAYAPTTTQSGSGGGGGSYSYTSSINPNAPTLTIDPTSIIVGNTANVVASCNGGDTCYVESPFGTKLVTETSPYNVVCTTPSTTTTCTIVNSINLQAGQQYTFYAYDNGPTYPTQPSGSSLQQGNVISGNLIVSGSANSVVSTSATSNVALAQNSISVSVPTDFLTPTYLKSNVAGYLLVPYNYTYTLTQQYSQTNVAPFTCGTNYPSDIEYCLPVNIINTQTNAILSGTQIEIIFHPNTISASDFGPDFQNIEFYDAQNGQILYSWLEGDPLNEITPLVATSNSEAYWIKLPAGFSIPANSATTAIYMGFGAATTDYYTEHSGVVGLAPQLTCSNPANTISGCGSNQYGLYDNGANVFNFYDNFAGKTLDANWEEAAEGNGGTMVVDNGLIFYQLDSGDPSESDSAYYMIRTANPYDAISAGSTYGIGYDVLESYSLNNGRLEMETSNGVGQSIGDSSCGHTCYDWFYNGIGLSWEPAVPSFELFDIGNYVTSGNYPIVHQTVGFTPSSLQLAWSGAVGGKCSTVNYVWVYNSFSNSICASPPAYAGSEYLSIMSGAAADQIGTSSGVPGVIGVQWARVRTSPPNSIQPTVTFGSFNPVGCPPVPAIFPSGSTQTYEVYTAEPVQTSSVLNETVESGPTLFQFQNWRKYFEANLSDEYLITPPELYFNVFTNRIFGEAYINSTITPSGLSAVSYLGGSDYVPSGLILNATHTLNYSQVKDLETCENPNVCPTLPPEGTFGGYSLESAIGPGLTPLTTHINPTNAVNASWEVVFNGVGGGPITITLDGTLVVNSIMIMPGVTLITDGHPVVATSTLINGGVIEGGAINDGGIFGGAGTALPLSYGGSGGSGNVITAYGGNTLVPGGVYTAGDGLGGSPGSANAIPTNLATSTLNLWAYDISDFLSGAGGGSGSYTSPGGDGSYGVYMQGYTLLAGTVYANGIAGNPGSGGGGGGVIVLAYGQGGFTPGVYDVNPGAGGCASTCGGQGGSGNVITYQYPEGNLPVPASRVNAQALGGADCGPICEASGYYYSLGSQTSPCPYTAYANIFCGNAILTTQSSPQITVAQLFSALKVVSQLDVLDLDLVYNNGVLGYNRLNYTLVDEFNNTINLPLDADLANVTTISLSTSATINSLNPNETTISVTGIAGYYPTIYAASPSPVPYQSDIYLYYDTDINFVNATSTPLTTNPNAIQYPGLMTGGTGVPLSPAASAYYQYSDNCAFGSIAGCVLANPVYTTPEPIGQGPLGAAEANIITFHTQYNGINQCSPESNSLLLPAGVNTMECNIYGDFGLPSTANTAGNPPYPEYCVPDFPDGNGVLTSQLGLVAILQTNQQGDFNDIVNVCGIGTGRIQASYYGYPSGQPVEFLQPGLTSPQLALSPSGGRIGPFYYACGPGDPGCGSCGPGITSCTIESPTPLTYSTEYNYSISPNVSISTFPVGTYYLSFGSLAPGIFLAMVVVLVVYIIVRDVKPRS